MGYAALFSGGKDSSLAIWKAQNDELEVEYLVTVYPENDASYMFHKPNLHIVPELAESLEIDLVSIESTGEKEEELKDLKGGLEALDIEGVITGAVASNYQLKRIKKIAEDLDIEIYAPLWNISQESLLNELTNNGFRSIIVSVSARGLDEEWLGRSIDKKCIEKLKRLEERYGINISGEGGEYESLVLGAPNYKWGFEIQEKHTSWQGRRGIMNIEKIEKKKK
ncbi:MAG: TIGR00289 family protein [Candidatus Thermoplasmatota archaeon]|nr:TIGR00289 family protein [Candidatus Thermoplasmatota archaeon]